MRLVQRLWLLNGMSLVLAAPAPVSGDLTSKFAISPAKRGLAYNYAANTDYFAESGQSSQVSWAYNWGPQPAGAINANLEFVPLLYNNDASLCEAWSSYAQSAIDNGTSALMSFNEPDMCQDGSACMNVSVAVATYKAHMQPFAGKALLGSPAITNDGSSSGSPRGAEYLSYFLGNCTGCQIDFIAMHWYSNVYAGVAYLKSHIDEVRAIAGGRPIWLTEYGLDTTEYYTDQQMQQFVEESMIYLDSQPDIARYAYFGDFAGSLLNAAGTAKSTIGQIYDNHTAAASGNIEIKFAFYADKDVTLLARTTLLSNNVLTVDTSCLSCILGGDPWWGVEKTLNILYTYNNQSYAFNVVEGSGSYTITPLTIGSSASVTALSPIAAPNSSSISILGAAWGDDMITARGSMATLYNAYAAGKSVTINTGLFGVDGLKDYQKAGVVWYVDSEHQYAALVGRDGDVIFFT